MVSLLEFEANWLWGAVVRAPGTGTEVGELQYTAAPQVARLYAQVAQQPQCLMSIITAKLSRSSAPRAAM
jgi:hypothetical protein